MHTKNVSTLRKKMSNYKDTRRVGKKFHSPHVLQRNFCQILRGTYQQGKTKVKKRQTASSKYSGKVEETFLQRHSSRGKKRSYLFILLLVVTRGLPTCWFKDLPETLITVHSPAAGPAHMWHIR